MIGWRSVAVDLRLLSNGVFLYAIFYLIGFGAYLLTFGESADPILITALPLIGLTMCVLSHISNERADRVDDQITVLLGGRRKRIATRMFSSAIYNFALVAGGFVIVLSTRHWHLELSPTWLCSALFIIAIYSTAGVIISAALPHPIISVALMSFGLFAGGPAPNENFLMRAILGMLKSQTWELWGQQSLLFACPWLVLAAVMLPFALGICSIGMPALTPRKRLRRNRVPRWHNLKPTFANRTAVISITNPIPLLATAAAMVIYTYSSVLLASKYADLNIAGNFFPLLAGIVLVNVMPAVMLASSAQRHEVDEQESFFFSSRSDYFRARVVQTSLWVIFIEVLIFISLARITGTDMASPAFGISVGEALYLAPGLSSLAIALSKYLRSPIWLALASYALTIPELLVSRFIPGLVGWLPSSLLAQVAGGSGLYARTPQSSVPLIVAWICVAAFGLTAALPLAANTTRKNKKSQPS